MATQSSWGRRLRWAASVVLAVPSMLAGAAVGPVAGPAVSPAAASAGAAGSAHKGGNGIWAGTWATVPTAVPPTNVATFEDQTIRQVVRVSVGGDTLRVRLSNEFGGRPLVIGAAHVARGAEGGAPEQIAEGTDRRLTFGGRDSVTVPPGAPALSDPVALRVAPLTDVVVSIHLPERTEGRTIHAFAFRQNVVAAGDVTGETKVTPSSVIEQWYFLTGVSVRTRHRRAESVVALGDSITDGANTTPGADRRWPDLL